MGQYWAFVCMDTRQSTGHVGKLGEIFFDTFPYEYLYRHLAVPDTFPQDLPLLPPIKKIGPNQPSAFEDLPSEIIEPIFMNLGDYENMLNLALSSYRFLELGHTCILKRFKATLSPWAGKRLICAGDYADSHPEDFLTKKELEELKGENLYNYADDSNGFSRVPHEGYTNLYNFGSVDEYAKYSNKNRVARQLIKACKRDNFFSKKPNVLRNLVTKEYVTEEDVKKETGKHNFDICNVLLSRICWSDDPSISICTDHGEELIKGKWAGQRFDIVTADKVDESWTNISEEAGKFVRQICDDDNQ